MKNEASHEFLAKNRTNPKNPWTAHMKCLWNSYKSQQNKKNVPDLTLEITKLKILKL